MKNLLILSALCVSGMYGSEDKNGTVCPKKAVTVVADAVITGATIIGLDKARVSYHTPRQLAIHNNRVCLAATVFGLGLSIFNARYSEKYTENMLKKQLPVDTAVAAGGSAAVCGVLKLLNAHETVVRPMVTSPFPFVLFGLAHVGQSLMLAGNNIRRLLQQPK